MLERAGRNSGIRQVLRNLQVWAKIRGGRISISRRFKVRTYLGTFSSAAIETRKVNTGQVVTFARLYSWKFSFYPFRPLAILIPPRPAPTISRACC
jgi:hypothetical protein